jgi:ATP synthase protein I
VTDDHRAPDESPTGQLPAGSAADADRRRADELRRVVLHKSLRRERARQRGDESIWAWLGTFGLVGWTVALPTLLGLAFGRFLDDRVDTTSSFTITFLVVGAAVGVSMAWYWVRRESEGDDEEGTP